MAPDGTPDSSARLRGRGVPCDQPDRCGRGESELTVRRRWRPALGYAVLATLLAGSPSSAQTPTPSSAPEPMGVALAPKPGTPGISPSGSHFEFGRVDIGATKRGVLVARNLGDTTETVQLYGADAIPARGGGFGFTPSGETAKDVGAWIRLDIRRIILGPRAEQTVSFEVVVPAGASAGEHIGGVVVEPVESVSGGGFRVGTRVAVGIYLTVAGSGAAALQPSLTITKLRAPVSKGQACPRIAYANNGTAVLDPTATITVDPGFGRKPVSYPAGKVGGLPPGAAVEVDLPCVRKVPIGSSRLTVTLDYPGGSAGRAVGVSRWPFSVVAAGLLLLLLLLALLWLFLARRRNDRDDEATVIPVN